MKRGVAIRILLLFCTLFFLAACKSNGETFLENNQAEKQVSGSDAKFIERISEEEAKQAGLALINLAFDANETDALVEYQARVSATNEGGAGEQAFTAEPDRVYVVKAAPGKGETDYYYAEVDAVTGFAFRAERFMSGIVLTDEQQKQADALGTLEEFDPNSLLSAQQDAMGIVVERMENSLEKDVPILRVYPDMIETDSVDFPKVQLEYFVLMENGKIYNVTLCWPAMELMKVNIRE